MVKRILTVALLCVTSVGCVRDAPESDESRLPADPSEAAENLEGTNNLAPIQDSGQAESAASCIGGIQIDGAGYVHDYYNTGRFQPEDVGELIGEVEHTYDCEAPSKEGVEEGIWSSSGLPEGTEIHALAGQPVDEVVVAIVDVGVEVYRSAALDQLATVLNGEVVAIGINSDFDGQTRFATIDDPAVVKALVDAARDGEETPDSTAHGSGIRYFIAFEEDNGLLTVVPYAIGAGQLGDRVVGEVWADAVTQALDTSEPAATIDGFTASGSNGAAAFHRYGACRHDRVDLEVNPGEHLRADYDESLELRWWMNSPQPSERQLATPSRSGAILKVPDFKGTMIVEAYLIEPGGDHVLEGCMTLGSSAPADSGPATAPESPEP